MEARKRHDEREWAKATEERKRKRKERREVVRKEPPAVRCYFPPSVGGWLGIVPRVAPASLRIGNFGKVPSGAGSNRARREELGRSLPHKKSMRRPLRSGHSPS